MGGVEERDYTGGVGARVPLDLSYSCKINFFLHKRLCYIFCVCLRTVKYTEPISAILLHCLILNRVTFCSEFRFYISRSNYYLEIKLLSRDRIYINELLSRD